MDLRKHMLWGKSRDGGKFHSPCQLSATGTDCLENYSMLKRILGSHPGSARSSDARYVQGYETAWYIWILHFSRWYLPGNLSYPKHSQEPGRKLKEHVWKLIHGRSNPQTHWNEIPSLLLPCWYYRHICLLGMLGLLLIYDKSQQKIPQRKPNSRG